MRGARVADRADSWGRAEVRWEHGNTIGIMGEVGCSWPLLPNERKVLRATARAQRLTGAPILIHRAGTNRAQGRSWRSCWSRGPIPGGLIVGHLERTIFDKKLLKELAETGCFLEYDFFGEETSFFPAASQIDILNDAQRLNIMAWLISEGHGGQLLVSHDIAQDEATG